MWCLKVKVYKRFLDKAELDYCVVAEPTPGLAAADAYIGPEDLSLKH